MPHSFCPNPSSVLRLYVDLKGHGMGEVEDSQSAIARPWRRLFQDGTDPGKICYLTLTSSPPRILGSFCETTGGRLLFFPACQGRELNSRFTRDTPNTPASLSGIVDHITFDIANRKGHITEVLANGERRVAVNLPSRPQVDSGLYAWFGITLRRLDVLDIVPGQLWFSTECPSSDVERRRTLFRTTGQTSRVCAIEIPDIRAVSFIQTNFFIDLQPEQTRNTMRTFLPKGPPELRQEINVPETLATMLQSLELEGGNALLRINPIVWEGEPIVDVAFGF